MLNKRCLTPRVIIVEDNHFVAEKLKLQLSQSGYQIEAVFASGEELLNQYSKLTPDIVLMDIVLEGEMDGIEAANRISEQYGTPVVYLTACSDEDFLTRAKITAPFAYILKPFNEHELEMAIAIALFKHTAEHELEESHAHLEKAQQIGHMGSWDWQITNNVLIWSKQIFRIFGLAVNEFDATYEAFINTVHPDDRDMVLKSVDDALYRQLPYDIDHRIVLPDGMIRFVHEYAKVEFDQEGTPVRMTGTVHDVTEVRTARDQLQLYEVIFQNASEGVIITDVNNIIEMVNNAYCEITGYSQDEVIGKDPRLMQSGVHDTEFYKNMWSSIREHGKWQGEIWDKRKDGEVFPKWLSITALTNSNDHITHYVGVFTDISELKQKEQRLHQLAYYDFLTGVANRPQFMQRLKQELAIAQRTDRTLAILYVDLDRFKIVNDSYGHTVGDALLRQVADRMRNCIRESDIIARIGGDEFSVILTATEDPDSAAKVANKLIGCLSKPFIIDTNELDIGVSIGISLYPRDGDKLESLVLNADRAMYHAKESGGNCYVFSNDELSSEVERRLFLDNHLRKALDKGQFELYYQPQFDLGTRRVTGMEALIRWQHPEQGIISPAEFIPRAEATNMIIPIGDWVLKTACAQNKAWQEAGFPVVPVAVNFSAAQLRSRSVVETISDCLQSTGLAAEYLDIEITESLAMTAPERTIDILGQLRELGALASIDDFGTGYSSLSHLKRLPASKLKIDRSFVNEITSDDNDKSIATAVIQLAKSMQLKVIAEGVETSEQLDVLQSLGCDYGQGYYYARPMPAAEMQAFLESHS
ncbi:MAG: EAL domain-containing protein [Gammaproteobacteria bacterium]|nr:EAL domain-containing protein [Gammaproteobacteria bacterium]